MPRVRTHPGEVLREEYLVPLGMSARALAKALGVPPNRITEIMRGVMQPTDLGTCDDLASWMSASCTR